MGTTASFLITILSGDELLKCALRVSRDKISEDCYLYYMEPENRETLRSFLPKHVREIGKIVHIEQIFEVEIIE